MNDNNKSETPATASAGWYTKSAKTVFESLEMTAGGLSKEEVNDRLVKYGPNKLPEPKARGPLLRFFYQFHNILIYVLIAAIFIWYHGNRLQYMVTYPAGFLISIIPG